MRKVLVKFSFKQVNGLYIVVMRQGGRVVATGTYDSIEHAEEAALRLLQELRKHKKGNNRD